MRKKKNSCKLNYIFSLFFCFINFYFHKTLKKFGNKIICRWLLSEISTSKYIPSPLARKYSEGSSSKPISNRWMTFTRYPSPSPIVRRNTERRPFNNDSKRAENNWFDRENTKARPANEYKAVQSNFSK